MEFLDQYEFNLILIGVILFILLLVTVYLLVKNIKTFIKDPSSSVVLRRVPSLSYDVNSEGRFDEPAYLRKGGQLSFDT